MAMLNNQMVTIKQNQTLIPGVISHLAGKATIVPYDFPIENTISAGFSKCWMILERFCCSLAYADCGRN